MGKQELDPRDAHTYRVYLRHSAQSDISSQEVVALYHVHENNFVVFKDNAHAAVLSIASASVLEIQRLRTHTILAVAGEELSLIIAALRENSNRLMSNAQDSDAVQTAKQAAFVADSLERLNPVAAERSAEDLSSMPRVGVYPSLVATSADGASVQYGRVTQSANE